MKEGTVNLAIPRCQQSLYVLLYHVTNVTFASKTETQSVC